MKSVTFVLPCHGAKPIGGLKIVYEYANYLACCDWRVEIIHIAWLNNVMSWFRGLATYFNRIHSYKPNKWFDLHVAIKTYWVFKLKKINAKKIIVTSWEAAELLYRQQNNDSDIYYLIQGDETKFDDVMKHNWQERVQETWKYNWKLIAINDFLYKMIYKFNQNIVKVTNGIDKEKYKIVLPIECREKFTVCMLGHVLEWKGTRIGVEALQILKNKYSNMQVTIFSTYPKMRFIPDWVNYEYLASQEKIVDIYNQSALFISCSYAAEGFGLPFVEAMACGCATVVSDIPTYRDIANETMTAFFEPGNIASLVDTIEVVLNDDEKRKKYAFNGNQHVKANISFEKSAESLEKYLLSWDASKLK